jgi:uncharacterized protein (TIGR02117 family)
MTGNGCLRLALLPPSLLLLALLLGALIPRNMAHRAAPAGIDIWVAASPAHTELIVPVVAAGHDWRRRISATQFADGREPTGHISLSWGERDFFLTTPTWADLDLLTGLRALFRSESSLIHVYRLDVSPEQWLAGSVRIRLTEEAYLRLAAGIDRRFAGGPPIPGYGPDDVFHPAHGRYSFLHTCNQWSADRLAEAGVRVGVWTPFSRSLMAPLEWHYGRDGA